MIPVSRNVTVYTLEGFTGDSPVLVNHGYAVAYDPQDHVFAALGLSAEQFRQADNVALRYGDRFYYPKWDGYKRMFKRDLAESYIAYLRRTEGKRTTATG